jgi:hypothetical protein
MKLECSGQIFETFTNINCHENPPSVSQVDPCGLTDKWADMKKPIVGFSQFCERA